MHLHVGRVPSVVAQDRTSRESLVVKIDRARLAELADGKKGTKEEVAAMARELLSHRDEEAKRDDGTASVHIEYVGTAKGAAAFPPQRVRMPRSYLHVGARITWAGRSYGVVSIDGDRVRVR